MPQNFKGLPSKPFEFHDHQMSPLLELVSHALPADSHSRRESLPFRVRIVRTETQLLAVQALRSVAYGHHLPELAESFGQADPIDRDPDTVIFFVEDKQTGQTIGSARIALNRHRPLQIERNIEVPSRLARHLLAEITRFTVLPGFNHLPVRLALVKASHMYCIGMQAIGVLAGARPQLLRQYRSLGFAPLFERQVPLDYAGSLPHYVLFRDATIAEADARHSGHPAHAFVFRTYHPDIELFDTVRNGLAIRADSYTDDTEETTAKVA